MEKEGRGTGFRLVPLFNLDCFFLSHIIEKKNFLNQKNCPKQPAFEVYLISSIGIQTICLN
jgi:hypothetical protein